MNYDPHDVEQRITDPVTGGQKGTKITQLGSIDPLAIIELSRVAGYGANKYAQFNYLKGMDWSLMFNAAQRHALLFWNGEDVDPESGLSHAAHAAWMFLALVSHSLRGLGTDTRFRQQEPVVRVHTHDYDDHAVSLPGPHNGCKPCSQPGCQCHHNRDR